MQKQVYYMKMVHLVEQGQSDGLAYVSQINAYNSYLKISSTSKGKLEVKLALDILIC